jgi:hypothetical protein
LNGSTDPFQAGHFPTLSDDTLDFDHYLEKFMKTLFHLLIFSSIALLMLSTALAGTATTPQADDVSEVEVVAVHDHEANRHLFRISNHDLASGWTTFRFVNASPVDHFFLIWQYPEEGIAAAHEAGQTLLDYWFQSVAGSFSGFGDYLEGKVTLEAYTDQLVAALQEKAPWFLDPGATPNGGPGFTAAGATSTTTVFLEPGDYIVECYVRDENGLFHTELGMLDHLSVGTQESGIEQPLATARVVISSDGGIEVETAPVAGSNTIEVHYKDQVVYPHFLGHNVQLVRLRDKDDDQALAAIAQWMDWRHPDGLVNRAPAGAHFVGGVMEMSAGASGFLHVNLPTGDYAWIAEVPEPADRGMLKTFTLTGE